MLQLTRAQLDLICAHATTCLPEESCGLIGGSGGIAQRILPITNRLHSPVRFTMDPREQLAAFQLFDREGLDLLAIWHSHPNGPQRPSPTDLAEFAYPGVLYIILSPDERELKWQTWLARAFSLDGLTPEEREIVIKEGE